MYTFKSLFVAMVAAMLMIGFTPSYAVAQVAQGAITVQSGSPVANALKGKRSCQEQVKALSALASSHKKDLDKILADCYQQTYEEYKRCDGCGKTSKRPPPKKTYAVVVECLSPAVKRGNTCVCDGGPLWKDDAGVGHGKPVLVKTKGSRSYFRTYTCTYNASDLEAFADRMDTVQKRVCKADKLPLLRERANQLSDAGVGESVSEVREGGLCDRTGEIIVELYAWSALLQSNRNGVPALNRDSWEELWNRVHELEDRVGRLEALYIDLRTGLCTICHCKGKEPAAKACKRFMDGLGAELDGLHEKDKELDTRLTTVEDTVAGQGDDIQLLRDNQWLVCAQPFGVMRFGDNTPHSIGVNGCVEYRSWFGPRSGMLAGAHFGYASTNNAEDHAVLGGRAGYLHAFDANRNSALFIGARGSAEIVERGTNAVDLMAQVGVQFCPGGTVCIEPWLALGGSNVVRQYENMEDRTGHAVWTGAGALGLNLSFLLGGGSSDDDEEPRGKSSSSTTSTSTSTSTNETVTSPPYDKGYRE